MGRGCVVNELSEHVAQERHRLRNAMRELSRHASCACDDAGSLSASLRSRRRPVPVQNEGHERVGEGSQHCKDVCLQKRSACMSVSTIANTYEEGGTYMHGKSFCARR